LTFSILRRERSKAYLEPEVTFMRESEPDGKNAAVIIAVLAILGVLSFAFAGVSIFENSTITATSSQHSSPHSSG
jgi:hypothetical protein